LVLAGLDQPSIFQSLTGTVSERVAETASVPTLVVRDAASLLRWASGERRVRVLVGVDGSAASIAALNWVDWLRKTWQCELIVACLETRSPLNHGHEVLPSLFMGEMVLKTAHMQERQFREHIRTLFGTEHVQVRHEKGWVHCDGYLIHLAKEERADLLVIGTHSRIGWARLLHHSVSRGVLQAAPCNVVCVPQSRRETQQTFPHSLWKPHVSTNYES
jgi:nucleotide-binding universal stress UspA family protein